MLNTARNTLPATQAASPAWVDVVCIQSQVVYGMVGNNVAVPILQAHDLSVAAVPTVLLSNTPHYPSVHGGVIPADWLRGFLNDLEARGALKQLRAVLIGYLGHPDQAAILARWIHHMRQEIPDLLVIIDPVIGDLDTGTYVHPELVGAYRQELLPLATGLTPNGYELGQLTQMPVGHEDDVYKAARTLLTEQTRWIAVTSAALGLSLDKEIKIAVVTKEDAFIISHPKVDCHCKGTGDLFSVNLVVHFLGGMDLYQAIEQAASHVMESLENTRAVGCEELVLLS